MRRWTSASIKVHRAKANLLVLSSRYQLPMSQVPIFFFRVDIAERAAR